MLKNTVIARTLSLSKGMRQSHSSRRIASLTLAMTMVLFASCSNEKPTIEFMPDMADQPSIKTQEDMRTPPAGTIPRGYTPYPYSGKTDLAARSLKNPLIPTMEILQAGRLSYNTYCAVCHGAKGEGDGSIIPKFPKPPSLNSEKIRDWRDGQIFHVMTEGQNLMPSYAAQVPEANRWAIVHYVRALQLAAFPSKSDVKRARDMR